MRKFTSLLLLGFALGSFAQTPGGVSGSELWFKTAPLNSDLQGYYRWQDFSGDSIRLMLLDSRGVKSELTLPNSSVHYFNFNPSLWLADGFRSLSAKLKHGNLSQATVIGVFAPELATIGKDMVVYALDGRKGDGAILSKDKAVRGRGVEPLDYGSASGEDLLYQSSDSLSENGFKESALRVVSYFKVSNPSTTLWGDNSNTTLFIGTPSTSGSFGTDFPTSLFGNASIRGYAPELIVFSRMLTPDERRKVESYLAVKYGITLKGSYLDSDGNLTWDIAENQAYHHRVTAVGTDTAGSLSQPLSATSYEESPVYAALKENGTYHDANPYNPSSASRLLVMGRENGNPMPDIEVKSPICSPLNSEDNELTDSITTNFSQSNVTYYGIRIWPQDEEYYQKSVENRLYLVLGINDTLVVISDNPIFFGANILSIRSKSRARKVYSRYNLNFDNDLPIRFYATSSSDTLIYEKIPIKSAPYLLSKGILKTNRLIGLPIYVGMPIKVLNRKVGIEGIIPLETLTEYKVMCVIHPEAVRSLWVDKQYIQSLKQLSHCDITMIILKLKDNKIDTIEFTNFGKYKMTDGMSVTSYLKFR